jgi:hypothetical protein
VHVQAGGVPQHDHDAGIAQRLVVMYRGQAPVRMPAVWPGRLGSFCCCPLAVASSVWWFLGGSGTGKSGNPVEMVTDRR